MRRAAAIICALLVPATLISSAQADKFHVTDEEKAACSDDARRFCWGSYPDEDKLLACMKINRSALSATCLVAFDAGVRRRHL